MASIPKTLARAIDHHRAGCLEQAAALYQQILGRAPHHPDALHMMGVLAWQQGRLPEALGWVHGAIASNPDAADYHSNLGLFLHSLGRLEESLVALDRALLLDHHHLHAQFHRGNTLHALKRHAEAASCFEAFLARQPSAEAHNNLANALLAMHHPERAVSHFQTALRLRPEYPEASNNLGVALRALGRAAEAEQCFLDARRQSPAFAPAIANLAELYQQQNRHAETAALCQDLLRLNPQCPEVWNNLGNAFQSLGRLEEALPTYHRALALHPDYFPAHSNLGNALFRLGRYDEALISHRKAVALQPHSVEALTNAAVVLQNLDRNPEAAGYYTRALQAAPDHPLPLTNFANLRRDQGRTAEAIALLRRALAANSAAPIPWNSLGACLSEHGEISEAIACFERALSLDPAYVQAHSNLLLNLHYLPHEPSDVFTRHRLVGAAFPCPAGMAHSVAPDPSRRPLRIGYVSSDFRRHSVACFLEPVLAAHDSSAVTIVCYSTVKKPDDLTARFRQLAGAGWRDGRGLTPEQLAARIRQDAIDILIDLGGHTADTQLAVFPFRPAPVAITWLGYPNTTGLDSIDYRITDAWADPPGQTEAWHTETLLRLPHGFSCYLPPAGAPAIAGLPSLAGLPFTFASFNNAAKINTDVLDAWAAILRLVPDGRLLLKSRGLSSQEPRQRIERHMSACSVDPARLEFSGLLPDTTTHLACYSSVDIALDTFPYNGATTTCEALWMGVPVVTLAGRSHVARVGLSILSRLDLNDWVAASVDEYVRLAAEKAAGRDALSDLRASLRQRMQASPLTNASLFTASLEQAYRGVWRKWCATRL